MKITFSIQYHTHWGEELFLMLGNDRYSALKMNYMPGDVWIATLDVNSGTRQLRYRYMVKEGGEVTRVERCACHCLSLSTGITHYRVDDCWDDNEDGLLGDDFIKRISGEAVASAKTQYSPGTVVIEALLPKHVSGVKLAVVGETPSIGEWNVRRVVVMRPCGDSLWRTDIKMIPDEFPAQFKLITVDKRGNVQWERGGNRWLWQSPNSDEVTIVKGIRFRHEIGTQPQAATLVEVATLRSDQDLGIGDLGDLKKVIQWALLTGQHNVVMGTIADAVVVDGWMPIDLRNQVMENAIDPALINVSSLGSLSDKRLKAQFQKTGMNLNQLDAISLDEVRTLKMEYSQALFKENGGKLIRTADYHRFIAANMTWLRPYAAQYLLQRVNASADPVAWGNYSCYNPEMIERFLNARHREAAFIYYLQYQLRQQLLELARFASVKGVTLCCDMSASRHVRYLDPKEPWINHRFIEQRLREAGRIALIPLRDWLLIDGDFLSRVVKSKTQRLAVSLEELIAAHDFNTRIKLLMTPERRTP